MPKLLDMAKSMPEDIDWQAAPPLALPAPQELEKEAELLHVPIDVTGEQPEPVDVDEEAGSAHGTPQKPPEKKTRRSAQHG